jgi:pimeloyl-ACP methyl ester carboxylesterase
MNTSISTPIVLLPGLNCSPRLYGPQLPALWRIGPVQVADHTRADTMNGIAASVLAAAPLQFHLVGLSMGGYIAFEILRQAPERVLKLALLDTSARADLPEQTERRRGFIKLAEDGRFDEINDILWPLLVHPSLQNCKALRTAVDAMAADTGPEAFARQQTAIAGRPDSRPDLPSIKSDTLVVVGEADQITPPQLAHEIANGISGARLEVVAECGHISTLERPHVMTRLLVEFLGSKP